MRNPKETIYTDQTGDFPITAQSRTRYVIAMITIDANAILLCPIKNRSDQELTKAYRILLGRAKATGLEVRKHVLDNECSNAMKELIRSECMLEVVTPNCHRRNIAEAAIKNFKNHFISILSGIDPNFPLKLWDKLLLQTKLTLNLLRQSTAAPTISAQAHVFGNFDFNRMPLAPMRCAVQIHEEYSPRRTWAPHSADGYCLGASPGHYRAHRIYAKATNAERVPETVFFKHKI